jgi:peptidoglycan/xylan/chitin deacetylase (PgdA/CDA1 family)
MLVFFAILAIGAVVLAHAAPFPCALDFANRDRAVWRLPRATNPPVVYLTFDDGPNPDATPALLDTLQRERAVATFFVIDKYVTPDTAPILRRMFAEGHGVALHSDTRRLMFMPPDELAATLTSAAARVARLAGHPPCRAFRPHAGFRSASMYAGLARLDYVLVGWGWNLWDWNWFRKKTARSIAPRLLSEISDGDIVVMHDGHHKNPRADRKYTVDTMARLVPALRAKGFAFGTICDALARDR